jgi:hypothetical protein
MTWHDTLIPILRWLTLAGMLFVCARLWRSGLHRRYRVFFVYLVFSSLRSGALLALDVRSGSYMKLWIITEPVLWIFYILLVLELYSLILESHKGLYTAGKWAMYGAVALALLFTFATIAPSSGSLLVPTDLMAAFMLIERALLLSLVVFLILLLAFLSRYPVTLSRNVLIHSVVYSAFFLSGSLTFLARTLLGWHVARPINTLVMAVTGLCVLAWAVLLGSRGEVRTRTAFIWNAGEEERLLGQLDTLNAALVRAARK